MLEAMAEFGFAVACLFAFIRFVLPAFERGAREHRQQVRQLKRNALQTTIAERQLALQRRLDGHEDCEKDGHAWGQWSAPKKVRTTSGNYDADQWRKCERCGQFDYHSTHNGGWAI